MFGDQVLYSHNFSDLEGVDITKRNLTLITVGAGVKGNIVPSGLQLSW